MSERHRHDEEQADAEFRERMRRIRRAAAILRGGKPPREQAATWDETIARLRKAAARLAALGF